VGTQAVDCIYMFVDRNAQTIPEVLVYSKDPPAFSVSSACWDGAASEGNSRSILIDAPNVSADKFMRQHKWNIPFIAVVALLSRGCLGQTKYRCPSSDKSQRLPAQYIGFLGIMKKCFAKSAIMVRVNTICCRPGM
jgi:hypothetical protein